MTTKYFLLPLISLLLPFSLQAQQNEPETEEPDTSSVIVIAPDDPISAMLDSLSAIKIFQNLENRRDTGMHRHNFPPDFIPTFSDSIYQARISRMNDNSPFEFVYNASVKAYIDLYALRRRNQTEHMLGLSQLYFPIFEEQLDRFNLPLELKYLAVIESALNPTARSRAGATGPWQFMYHTGRLYGLQVNNYVDERSDVLKATIAACEHFRDLYKIYEDWSLVIAAYNAGPGNVNRAIRRAGGIKDFWKIGPFLPRETRNYVPAFIAVTYVMEHADEHNLYAVPPVYSFLDVDTIHVRQQLSLRTLSELLDIPFENLRYLNPTYRKNLIPNQPENPYVLILPKEQGTLFLANEESIYNYRSPEEIRQEELAAQMKETTFHVVRSGEVLGSIARRYGTSVREIQRLNNMRGTLIRPGQRLIVRAPADRPVTTPSSANVHVVKRGETLGIIASRYRVSVSNLMEWNKLNNSNIRIGQQLIVRPPEGRRSASNEEVSETG
ncbi:MAG: LysM peptidoglycan-binding domain-containing protein [Bacteroides sp.]|jgi:membrane-bound lytic murein transglycosylase D|nr:LysM peptidoglycan-binding domain-containing protein [Bacteroides sp.]